MEVLTIAKLDHQLNEEIRDKEVRLIGADGAQLGIMSSAQANALAEEQGLDLVKISPNAVPPVCKIMDYSKFCYDQKKRAQLCCVFLQPHQLSPLNLLRVFLRFRQMS